jgi:hypothetical protein
MTIGDPQMLISRHVNRLVQKSEMEDVEKVLRRVDLVRQGGMVRRSDGSPMSFEDCYRYKQAVKEILGSDVYTYAKVNFVLGGCRCQDCQSEQRQTK